MDSRLPLTGTLTGTLTCTLVSLLIIGLAFSLVLLAVHLESSACSPAMAADRDPAVGGASDSLLLDFEDGDLTGWRPRPGDEPYIHFAIEGERALQGRRSLYCRVRKWDDTVSANEQVVLRYDLPGPLLLDASTEVSWSWWIGDRLENDGVGIRLVFSSPAGARVFRLECASHSNRERGKWPYDDPSGRICQHRLNLQAVVRERISNGAAFPSLPWYLTSLEFYFWFPQDQTAYFDEIRIGPPRSLGGVSAAAPRSTSITPPETSMLLADLNSDNRLDRIVGLKGKPPLVWLGAGHIDELQVDASQVGLGSAVSLVHPIASDLDGDGILDLLGFCNDNLKIFEGLGAAHFREVSSAFPRDLGTNRPAGLLAVDLLPGPKPQLLICRYNGLQDDSIYIPTGRTACFHAQSFPCLGDHQERLGYRSAIIAADVDNDHDQDLFCTNSDLFLQEESGLVCATCAWLPQVGTHQSGAVFGDIDNDGDLDLFITVDIKHHVGEPGITHGHSLLYRNDGERFVDVSHWVETEPSGNADDPIFADFDLDGDLDLFFTQERWRPTERLPNIYLENDGTGRFRPGNPGAWIMRTPSAEDVWCFDADDDGDPDLLFKCPGSGRYECAINNITGRRAIKVRVLDQRGAPHASGAELILRARPNASKALGNDIVGYRQTGAGALLSGWSEAIFGVGQSEGPFDLTVIFPSRPESPLILRGLRPGESLVVVEPMNAGPFGSLLAGTRIQLRRATSALASAGSALIFPGAVLCGLLMGCVLYGFRRSVRILRMEGKRAQGLLGTAACRPGPAPIPGGMGGWFGPRLRKVALLVAVIMFGLIVIGAQMWPAYPKAVTSGWMALLGLCLGIALGMEFSHLDSTRRRALRMPHLDSDTVRIQLLDAIDGFSHASWLKYLAGVASLSRSLAEGADPQHICPRLEKRLESYDGAILPQMTQIEHLLPHANLGPTLAAGFMTDLKAIEEGVRVTRERLLCGNRKRGPLYTKAADAFQAADPSRAADAFQAA
ncbi:MAG: VCBS repeat-containing protein, partial [Candidatus Eisenbacteria sp.]|nr:VCBS repeat-containing protein [Candidatus Eisenbacteria bacterium]